MLIRPFLFSAWAFVLLFASTLSSAANLTPDEQRWLADHGGKVHFASLAHYTPFEFCGADGSSQGMAIDLTRWIAQEMGFEAVFEHGVLKSSIKGVLNDDCDAITSLFYSKERAQNFGFTPVVFEVPASIFVLSSDSKIKSIRDLRGKVLAVQDDDYAEEYLREKEIDCQFVFTSSFKKAVDAVSTGAADALIGDEQVVYHYLYQKNWTDKFKTVGHPLYVGQCCMAVSVTNSPLLSILSKGVSRALASGVVAHAEQNWLGLEYTSIGFQSVHYIRYVFMGIGLLLISLFFFWLWDVHLSRTIQKRTKQLRSSEERLRTIFQNSPDAIYIQDERGVVLDANPMACSFHGMTHGELVGSNVLDLIPESKRDDFRKNSAKGFSKKMTRYESVLLCENQKDIPVEIIGTPLSYEGKTAVLLLVRDMTEHKRVEQALEESERRYRGLIETQSNFIIRVDVNGRLTFVNEAFCRFVGRSREVLNGALLDSYVCYDSADDTRYITKTLAARRERVVTVEYRMRSINPSARVRWENIAVFDEHGDLLEIQSVGQDVTESHRVHAALTESEKRLRFLFEEIPHIAVQGYNANRETIFWNRASEALYGYSKKEVFGKKIEDLVYWPDQVAGRVGAFDAWVRTGCKIPSGEMIKRAADGREVSVYSSRLATRNQQGGWEMYVIDIDLSELKRASEELVKAKEFAEKANRAKSEFLANMSHEIRTPMNGVMGMTGLLLDTQLDEEQRGNVQTIMECTQELLGIIDELLDISRVEAGEVRLTPEPFSPRETVGKIIQLFAERCLKKGVRISVNIEDSVPDRMMGDAGRIRQIIINLIGNSLKFTSNGQIVIHLKAEKTVDGWNLLTDVTDTGIGMSPDLVSRVFEKFTQGDTSSKRKYGGTGLGMAISRQLVQLMEGAISVTSEEGKGSCFRFNLRLPDLDPEVAAPVEVPGPLSMDLPKFCADILLVEDNLVNQKVAVAMLKKVGCQVWVAGNGALALKQLPERTFDLIFMDCQMPVMDGFETTRAIRQMVGTVRDIPIIAMTAHALKEDREKCLVAGMDDYLSKPVRRDLLIAILQKYCGQQAPVAT